MSNETQTFIATFILLADVCIQIDLRREAENNPDLQLYFCKTGSYRDAEQPVPIKVKKKYLLNFFFFFCNKATFHHVLKMFYPNHKDILSDYS